MAMTVSHLQEYDEKWCLLNVALTSKDFLDVALDELWEDIHSFMPLLELLPALQVKDDEYVCANVHAFSIWPSSYVVFSSLVGMFLRKIGIDCSITLEESSLYVSTRMPMVSRFILRLIFKLLDCSHLVLSSHLFVTLNSISARAPVTSSFSYHHSLIHFNSTISVASKILLLDHFWLPFQVPLWCSGGLSFVLDGCQRTF